MQPCHPSLLDRLGGYEKHGQMPGNLWLGPNGEQVPVPHPKTHEQIAADILGDYSTPPTRVESKGPKLIDEMGWIRVRSDGPTLGLQLWTFDSTTRAILEEFFNQFPGIYETQVKVDETAAWNSWTGTVGELLGLERLVSDPIPGDELGSLWLNRFGEDDPDQDNSHGHEKAAGRLKMWVAPDGQEIPLGSVMHGDMALKILREEDPVRWSESNRPGGISSQEVEAENELFRRGYVRLADEGMPVEFEVMVQNLDRRTRGLIEDQLMRFPPGQYVRIDIIDGGEEWSGYAEDFYADPSKNPTMMDEPGSLWRSRYGAGRTGTHDVWITPENKTIPIGDQSHSAVALALMKKEDRSWGSDTGRDDWSLELDAEQELLDRGYVRFSGTMFPHELHVSVGALNYSTRPLIERRFQDYRPTQNLLVDIQNSGTSWQGSIEEFLITDNREIASAGGFGDEPGALWMSRFGYTTPPLYKKFSGVTYRFVHAAPTRHEAEEWFVRRYDPDSIRWRIAKRILDRGTTIEYDVYVRPFDADMWNPLQAQTLTERDVLDIARDLETGRGLIPDLAKRDPLIPQVSQEHLRQTLGDRIPLYRLVNVRSDQTEGRQPDGTISGSINPLVPYRMGLDVPMFMTETSFITAKQHFLYYDVPIERVLTYVPGILATVYEQHGGALDGIEVETRSGGTMTAREIFDEVIHEQEVVADVTGLEPVEMVFGASDEKNLFEQIAYGEFTDVPTFMDYIQKNTSTFYGLTRNPPGSEKPFSFDQELWDENQARLEAKAVEMEAFLAPSVLRMTGQGQVDLTNPEQARAWVQTGPSEADIQNAINYINQVYIWGDGTVAPAVLEQARYELQRGLRPPSPYIPQVEEEPTQILRRSERVYYLGAALRKFGQGSQDATFIAEDGIAKAVQDMTGDSTVDLYSAGEALVRLHQDEENEFEYGGFEQDLEEIPEDLVASIDYASRDAPPGMVKIYRAIRVPPGSFEGGEWQPDTFELWNPTHAPSPEKTKVFDWDRTELGVHWSDSVYSAKTQIGDPATVDWDENIIVAHARAEDIDWDFMLRTRMAYAEEQEIPLRKGALVEVQGWHETDHSGEYRKIGPFVSHRVQMTAQIGFPEEPETEELHPGVDACPRCGSINEPSRREWGTGKRFYDCRNCGTYYEEEKMPGIAQEVA